MNADFQAPPVQAPPVQDVSVTILIEGGQQQTIHIQSNNLLLQQLFETLLSPSDKRPQRLFQIPVQDGKAILCFPSDRLVGLVTEPPLVLQQQPQAPAAQPGVDSLAPGA